MSRRSSGKTASTVEEVILSELESVSTGLCSAREQLEAARRREAEATDRCTALYEISERLTKSGTFEADQ